MRASAPQPTGSPAQDICSLDAAAGGRSLKPPRPGSAPSRDLPRIMASGAHGPRLEPLRGAASILRPPPARPPLLSRAGKMRLSRRRTFPSDGDLSPCYHSLRRRPTRRRSGWSDAENWEEVKISIGAAAAAFAERCGFKPKAGRLQFLPGEGRGARRRPVRRRRGATRRHTIRSPPASSRRRCPRASTGSPTRLKTPISPRSASCSGSTL